MYLRNPVTVVGPAVLQAADGGVPEPLELLVLALGYVVVQRQQLAGPQLGAQEAVDGGDADLDVLFLVHYYVPGG